MLDRLDGPDPPKLIVRRPARDAARRGAPTSTSRSAAGTNLALLNALVHEVIANGWIDDDYVDAHAVGFDALEQRSRECTPEWAAEICDVDAEAIRAAARADRHRASACSADRAPGRLPVPPGHRRRLPGQQPRDPARDARPAGLRRAADERPADRAEHARDRRQRRPAGLSQLGQRRARRGPRAGLERRAAADPALGPPTHAMEIFRSSRRARSASCGSPRPTRRRRCPSWRGSGRCSAATSFLVVQDIFATETTALADVVLPAATWGEKTGDVHERRSHRAPLREGRRPAGRGAGRPRHLPRLRAPDGLRATRRRAAGEVDDAESAFEAWQACARGRPCAYDGHHLRAAARDGVRAMQWGGERLYADGRFFAAPDVCESYGRTC